MLLSILVVASLAGFPRVTNSETDERVSFLSPEEAVQAIELPAGFSATVFAAEPDVQNPICMAWDPQGRLWIGENYTYAEREKRFDLTLRDRVVVFEDRDGDGKADHRQVFTDSVQMLTSVEVGHGGVWLMCPPNLLFVADKGGDTQPDGPPEVVLDGFTVAEANYHNFANGLRFGPDGWLYGRCGGSCPARIGRPGTSADKRKALEGGMWRFHPKTRAVEVLATGTTNPWGHDWDEHYEAFFVNTVNGHLWHLIPGSHLVRPFTLDPNPYTFKLIDMHADHWHFDTGKSWNESRDGNANSLGGGHAHSGAMIYLGGTWPDEYHNRLFTLNFHGRRANTEFLARSGSGYVAKHGPDHFLSSDRWFRGIDLSYGPDGNVYVLDWSDTGECHEHNGVHRTSGRVFKISYPDNAPSSARTHSVFKADDAQLAQLHRSRNEWHVRQARLELTRRATLRPLSDVAIRSLRDAFDDETLPTAQRLRALLTLYTTEQFETPELLAMLSDSNPFVRAWAVRLLTDFWPIDDAIQSHAIELAEATKSDDERAQVIACLVHIAATDNDAGVRLALASTLQRFPLGDRPRLAAAITSHAEDADDHNLPLLVWYGLIPVADQHAVRLADLVASCRWPQTRRLIARRLASTIEKDSRAVERLLEIAITDKVGEDEIRDVVNGLLAGFEGWRKATRPTNWIQFEDRFSRSADVELANGVRQLRVLFGDGFAMQEVTAIALNDAANFAARQSALRTLISAQPHDLREICAKLLTNQKLNVLAAEGLAQFDSQEVGELLVSNYHRFRAPNRPNIISILASRRSFAMPLLDALEGGQISGDDLTAFDVRQLHSLEDEGVTERITRAWGEVRESANDKLVAIDNYRKRLTPDAIARADKSRGRVLFMASCAKCHRMYGEGEQIGPDLTGSNRSDLDYLLQNILDPSAVVGKDFRMTVLHLEDGRTLNGLVVTEDPMTLALQTQTEKQIVLKSEIAERTMTGFSPMPDGLLSPLTGEEVRDLIGYLRHPTQVELPAVNR